MYFLVCSDEQRLFICVVVVREWMSTRKMSGKIVRICWLKYKEY